jgi:kinesin family protein 18/19
VSSSGPCIPGQASNTIRVFDPAEENPMAKYQKTILPQGKRVKDMRFGFDRVFDETCSQQDVYEATTKSLLDSVLDGFNATVFAYGATGCGKTHTIRWVSAQNLRLGISKMFTKRCLVQW